jgi:hypothetical protein
MLQVHRKADDGWAKSRSKIALAKRADEQPTMSCRRPGFALGFLNSKQQLQSVGGKAETKEAPARKSVMMEQIPL